MRPRLQISVCAGRTGSCVVELRGSIPDLSLRSPLPGARASPEGEEGEERRVSRDPWRAYEIP